MAINKKELTTTLNKFYQQPVAKVSLELFLSVVTVIFFIIFAIRPTLVTMSDLVKEIEDKRELDQEMTQKIAALSTVQITYSSLQDRLSVLDEAIPLTPDFINSIKIIEKVASDRNLVITNISTPEVPKEIEGDVKFMELERTAFPLTLSLEGNYSDIRAFVEDLLSTRRTFITDTVTFATSDERGQKKLRTSITLLVPYFGKN